MPAMNPLFLGLVAAGIVLVAGVLIYNWLQERRVRRRIDAAFRKPERAAQGAGQGIHDGSARIEPMLPVDDAAAQSVAIQTEPEEDEEPLPDDEEAMPEELPQVAPATRAVRQGLAPDADIECVALLQGEAPVDTAALGDALSRDCAKPVRWLGRRGPGAAWQQIEPATQGLAQSPR